MRGSGGVSNPFFLTIEGIDGAGKTSQAKLVCEKLKREGYDAVVVSPVKSVGISDAIRQRLSGNVDKHEMTMALLFAADRTEMYKTSIEPVLERGGIVISDRYLLSTYVYQRSKSMSLPWLRSINKGVPSPSGRIVLDISPDVAMERVVSRGEVLSKYETLKTLTEFRDRFRNYEHECLSAVINGEMGPSSVTNTIVHKIHEWGV